MSYLGWLAIVGALLLLMALSSAYIRRLPISTAAIYLIVGAGLSSLGLNLLHINLLESKVWIERLTELAVIISLFLGGLKLRLPLVHPAWYAAYLMAGPVMIFSIIGVALVAHFGFGLSPASAILLGAVLAPTDPVLAGAVAVNDAADHDRMRYGLSGEAGLNDGMAFPFVMFGLLWIKNGSLGNWIGEWALREIVWAIPAGLAFGFILGHGVGRLAIWLRNQHQETDAPNDFLALSLIVLSYVGAETIGAWGFLATFAAGVGLRRAEMKVVKDNPLPHTTDTDDARSDEQSEAAAFPLAEAMVAQHNPKQESHEPAISAGVVVAQIISFGDTAERLLEVLLVVVVGVCLAEHWDWRAVPLALALFFVIRPLFTHLCLLKTPTDLRQRWLMGWFGLRGVGSLYYLSYALNHGWRLEGAEAAGLVISLVAVSILVHGISAQPILDRYEQSFARQRTPRASDLVPTVPPN